MFNKPYQYPKYQHIRINDAKLFTRAKMKAAYEQTTLSALVEKALREYLTKNKV